MAIFKENELASYPLILHKTNIVWLKFFVASHNYFVAQQSTYVMLQTFFVASSVARHCDAMLILMYKG